jgi:hypothetical protein
MTPSDITPTDTDTARNESTPLLSSFSKPIYSQPSSSSKSPLPWYSRASPFWLLPACLIVALAWGLILAPRIKLYVEVVCENHYASKINSIGLIKELGQTERLNGVDKLTQAVAMESLPGITGIGGLLATITKFTFDQPPSNISYNPHFESDYDDPPEVECNIPEIQAITSNLLLLINLCAAIPGMFSNRMKMRMAGRELTKITIIYLSKSCI